MVGNSNPAAAASPAAIPASKRLTPFPMPPDLPDLTFLKPNKTNRPETKAPHMHAKVAAGTGDWVAAKSKYTAKTKGPNKSGMGNFLELVSSVVSPRANRLIPTT